jgi:hypothetical protein
LFLFAYTPGGHTDFIFWFCSTVCELRSKKDRAHNTQVGAPPLRTLVVLANATLQRLVARAEAESGSAAAAAGAGSAAANGQPSTGDAAGAAAGRLGACVHRVEGNALARLSIRCCIHPIATPGCSRQTRCLSAAVEMAAEGWAVTGGGWPLGGWPLGGC